MWSVVVVAGEVAGERFGALLARWVGEAVGPFAEQCFDERFGFPVGLGASGPGVAALDAELGARVAPGERPIAVAVVGEDAFDRDALLEVPGRRSVKERAAIGGAFAREYLRVGQA